MSGLVRLLRAVSAGLERGALWLACAGLAVMVVCILVQIVSRYLIAEPLAWTEELARYAMIWSGLAGATVAYRRGLDPVLLKTASLPKAWMRAAARWIELAAVSLFAVAVLIGIPPFLALHAQRVTETLQAPSVAVVLALPAALVTILIHAIARASETESAAAREETSS
jgi:TRAP-type C4-dicarboxylate transport system permease small subunit